MNNTHITKEQLIKFHAGTLDRQEEQDLLMHVAGCTHCSQLFAESFEDGPLLMAPRELKEAIIADSKRIDTQLSVQARRCSRQIQLILYSLKVSAAVAASLLFLAAAPKAVLLPLSQPRIPAESQTGIVGWMNQESRQIGDFLNQISQKLFISEGNYYD